MKLFGYSISLNVIILIGILYLIMVVNALSSSCNREGLTNTSEANTSEVLPPAKDKLVDLMKDINDAQAVNAPYAPIPRPSPILPPSQLMQPKYNSAKQLEIMKRGVAKAAQAAAKAAQAAAKAAQAAQAAAQAAQDAQYDAQDAQYDALQ